MNTAYKVLVDGASCHGGSLEWSLPTMNTDGSVTPGDEVDGTIEACVRGLHLTRKPAHWWKSGAAVFEAEFDGDVDEADDDGDDKFAVRRCRLLREVAWDDHQVWSDGEHVVRDGRAVASYSATVEASGSATVRAFGSANAIRTRWHRGGYVKLEDLAAVIDRRVYGTVEFHQAPWSDAPAESEVQS